MQAISIAIAGDGVLSIFRGHPLHNVASKVLAGNLAHGDAMANLGPRPSDATSNVTPKSCSILFSQEFFSLAGGHAQALWFF